MFLLPKKGLTLGGGGARGGAHLGALRVLGEVGYVPKVIVGTSVGGLIGALIGAGWPQARLEQYFTTTNFGEFLQIDRTGRALLGIDLLQEELNRLFGQADLRDLSPQVAVMAADLRQRCRVALTAGPVVSAILATIAVPGLFPAIRCGESLFVDGGVNDNVPTQATYMLGANRVVAVDLSANPGSGLGLSAGPSVNKYLERAFYWLLDLSNRQTAFETVVESNVLTYNTLVQYQLALFPPGVLIRPDMPAIGMFSTDKVGEAIAFGEQVAHLQIGRIKSMNRGLVFPRRRQRYSLPPLVIGQSC